MNDGINLLVAHSLIPNGWCAATGVRVMKPVLDLKMILKGWEISPVHSACLELVSRR